MQFFKTFLNTFSDIRNLTIQGAENVAHRGAMAAAQEILDHLEDKELAYSTTWYLDSVSAVCRKILSARPTEPHLYNSLEFVFGGKVPNTRDDAIDMLKKRMVLVERHHQTVKQNVKHYAREELSQYHTAYTHCHSSMVVAAILGANIKEVHQTETRPRYQGRGTAQSLLNEGVHVHHYVDSAMMQAIAASDVILLGADAVSMHGDVINKVGSAMVAFLAYNAGKPLYIITDSYKLDKHRADTPIERRDPSEIWEHTDKNLTIHNPAFEKIPSRYIHRIISENGIFIPEEFVLDAEDVLSFAR